MVSSVLDMNNTDSYMEEIPDLFMNIVTILEEAESNSNSVIISSVSDSYYRSIDSKKELFCVELPEYVGVIPLIKFHTQVEEIASKTPISRHHIRDIVRAFREFCYYHGFRYNEESPYMPMDLSSGNNHPNREVIEFLNAKISKKMLTNQQAGLLCRLAEEHINIVSSSVSGLAKEVLNEMLEHFISEAYKSNLPESEMDWNRLGGGVDTVYNEIHHTLLTEM